MDAGQIARYARQIALPEVGPEGQAAICGARVLIVGSDLAAETASAYLSAAGVGSVETRSRTVGDGAAWLDALGGVDLVIRTDFDQTGTLGGFLEPPATTPLGEAQLRQRDDDAMLGAAARLGVPVIVARADGDRVDLLSFPRRDPNPNAEIDIRARPAQPTSDGATGVLAGTLAAAEALATLLRDDAVAEAASTHHLRLPVDGGEPIAQKIPPP